MSAIPADDSGDFYLKAALIYCAKAGLDPEAPVHMMPSLPTPRSVGTYVARKVAVASELRDFDNRFTALLDARR